LRPFLCFAEPTTLLCVNKQDGTILWQKSSSFEELELSVDVRDQLKVEQAEVARLDKSVAGLAREAETIKKRVKDMLVTKEDADKELEQNKTRVDALKDQRAKLLLAAPYPLSEPLAGSRLPLRQQRHGSNAGTQGRSEA
jgi:hypothetical protein